MKIILFFLFIFLFFNFSLQNPPRCITVKNTYAGLKEEFLNKDWSATHRKNVDWWFLYQVKPPGGAIYTDSDLQPTKTINEIIGYNTRKENEYPSPILETFLQAYDTANFRSIAYSDKIRKKDNKGEGAHAKGFFIWNDYGGIHVIHSYTQSPEKGTKASDLKFFKSYNSHDKAQHSVCISLTVDELKIIPKYIITAEVTVVFVNGVLNSNPPLLRNLQASLFPGSNAESYPNNFPLLDNGFKTFKELDNFINSHLFDNGVWNRETKFNKWASIARKVSNQLITSIDVGHVNCHYNMIMRHGEFGRYFIQTTNKNLHISRKKKLSDTYKKDIKYYFLQEYIHQYDGDVDLNYSKIDWISQTETFYSGSLDRMAPKLYDTLQQSEIFETPWDLPYKFEIQKDKTIIGIITSSSCPSNRDHSKLLYGTTKNGDAGVMCFGDLNWQGKQESRGGGFYCNKNMLYLVDYFKRHVSIMKDVNEKKENVKFLIKPNSIANVPLNFSPIKDILEKEGVEVLNFEIKVFRTISSVYLSLSPKIIVMNGLQRKEPKFEANGNFKFDEVAQHVKDFQDKYNVGYESVYAPLLLANVGSLNAGSISFTSEKFSFNVFVSPVDKKFLMCPNNVQNCQYEDSEQIVLFSDMQVQGKLIPRQGKEQSQWTDTTFSSPLKDAITDETIKKVKEKIELVKGIGTLMGLLSIKTKLKFIETTELLSDFKYSDDVLSKINTDHKCFIQSNNPDTIIVQYHPKCFDQLIFCLIQISNPNFFQRIFDTISFVDGINSFFQDGVNAKIINTSQDIENNNSNINNSNNSNNNTISSNSNINNNKNNSGNQQDQLVDS
ncbi:hypothetical protein ACTFIZ_010631 [Dictyostelium cf. discoideum]